MAFNFQRDTCAISSEQKTQFFDNPVPRSLEIAFAARSFWQTPLGARLVVPKPIPYKTVQSETNAHSLNFNNYDKCNSESSKVSIETRNTKNNGLYVSDNIFTRLKNRFTGKRGNELVISLIDMLEFDLFKDIGSSSKFSVLEKELETFLVFSNKRNMRIKVNAQFDLIHTIQNTLNESHVADITAFKEIINSKFRKYNSSELAHAKVRYLSKKIKRKNKESIRYEGRQVLANKRNRTKGKFAVKQRCDIVQLAKAMEAKCTSF